MDNEKDAPLSFSVTYVLDHKNVDYMYFFAMLTRHYVVLEESIHSSILKSSKIWNKEKSIFFCSNLK